MTSFKVSKLPSVLEKIAADYDKPHEEVGLDALMAYTHYTREKGMLPSEAYCATIDSLHSGYQRGKK